MKTFTILTALIGALAIPAVAQDVNDGPGPGVARLSLAEGDVVIRRGDSGEFVAAETNAPLVALDHVLTGSDGRAEIQFDYANRIRLAADSEVRMAALEDGDFFIQIPVGTATFSVLEGTEALVEISTPTVSVRPREAGSYRIDVGPDGATEVTVRSGEAELFTALQTEILGAGRTLEIRGDPAAPELIVLNPRPIDDWDRWNAARDSDLRDDDVYRYVSRDIYGAEDLRGHGRWVYDSPYGWVWVPNASPTWAPYRVGRWTWIDYYGWTWVSGDPWGWAPYHYGRWYYASRLGWVWHPGTRLTRHYWRPALVTFFGWGSGGLRVNVSLNFGYRNVGWVPLAPYEVYRPWYGRYPRTNVDVNINNVTVINNVNIVNTYRNARFVDGRNAVTSVPAPDFGRNRVSVNNFVRVSDRDLDGAGEVRGRVPLDPGAAGRRFSDRTVDARSVREAALDPGLLPRRDGRPPRNAVAEAPATPGRGNGRGAALDDTGAGRGASRNAAAQDAPSGVSPARGVNGPGRAEEPQAGRAARGAAPEERGRAAASAPSPGTPPRRAGTGPDNAPVIVTRGQGNGVGNSASTTVGRGASRIGRVEASPEPTTEPAPAPRPVEAPQIRTEPSTPQSNGRGNAANPAAGRGASRIGRVEASPEPTTEPAPAPRRVEAPQAGPPAPEAAPRRAGPPSASAPAPGNAGNRTAEPTPAPRRVEAPQPNAPEPRPGNGRGNQDNPAGGRGAARDGGVQNTPPAAPEPRGPEARPAPEAPPAPSPAAGRGAARRNEPAPSRSEAEPAGPDTSGNQGRGRGRAQ